MSRTTAPLSDAACRLAKPTDRAYKLFDGDGLYLLVQPNGRKGWRLRYVKPDGREGLTSFGNYPVIGLADARRKRLEVKRMLADGVDPIETKHQAKAEAAPYLKAPQCGALWFLRFGNWCELKVPFSGKRPKYVHTENLSGWVSQAPLLFAPLGCRHTIATRPTQPTPTPPPSEPHGRSHVLPQPGDATSKISGERNLIVEGGRGEGLG